MFRLHDKYFTVIINGDDKILLLSDLDEKISNALPKSDSFITYKNLEGCSQFSKNPVDIEILH